MNRQNHETQSPPADFTLAHWREILRIGRQHYPTRMFTDFEGQDTFVLWRHDVDFSPQRALRMAEVEAEEGVHATYFVHLHNAFYNALERPVVDVFKKTLDRGHHLGLHFDCGFYGFRDLPALEDALRAENALLARIFGTGVTAFSLHNPDPFFLQLFRAVRCGDLVNTYADYFRTEVGYSSDSNGYWRHEPMEDVILSGRNKRLQLLTHPAWWQDTVMSPRKRIQRCIDGRAQRTAEWYDATLAACGRENVDRE